VKFSRARFLHDPRNVRSADPRAGNDGDAVSGRSNEFGQQRSAFEGALGATGRQDPARARSNDIFECFAQIRAIVECAMEGDRQRTCKFDKLSGARNLNAAPFS
jgi:hypothetical protein